MHPPEIDIRVQTRYVPEASEPIDEVYGFAYTITITNLGDAAAQLISRHWVIEDSDGHLEEVRGLGVVGHQPLLQPGESFQYSSGCELRTSSGTMHGSYLCVTDEGETFTAPIRLFMLEAFDSGADARPLSDRILH